MLLADIADKNLSMTLCIPESYKQKNGASNHYSKAPHYPDKINKLTY